MIFFCRGLPPAFVYRVTYSRSRGDTLTGECRRARVRAAVRDFRPRPVPAVDPPPAPQSRGAGSTQRTGIYIPPPSWVIRRSPERKVYCIALGLLYLACKYTRTQPHTHTPSHTDTHTLPYERAFPKTQQIQKNAKNTNWKSPNHMLYKGIVLFRQEELTKPLQNEWFFNVFPSV